MGAFKDHFSKQAAAYAEFRPRYPEDLFLYLADLCSAHDVVWDCATGNGQAASGLTAHFRKIIATDASVDQIALAPSHEKISYAVTPAEGSGLQDASVDLVTVAQALHWFNPPRFFAEAERVLKPGGVLAVWSYELMTAPENPAIDAAISRYYRETVGSYWPPERRHVENGYRDLALPFPEIKTPAFTMRVSWTLEHVIGYLRSWSATQKFVEINGADPTEGPKAELADLWESPGSARELLWPIALKAAKKA